AGREDTVVEMSGTVILKNFRNAMVTLGDSGQAGALTINLSTGRWQLDGFRIVLPKFLMFDAVTLGWSYKDARDWDLLVAGGISLAGKDIQVKIPTGEKAGKFVIESFGVQVRGLNPGIALGDSGLFITDLGLEGENLTTNQTIRILLGAAFGGKIAIAGKEYALAQLTVQGQWTRSPGELDIAGALLIGGGILGQITVQADLAYGLGKYTLDLDGKLVYDVFEGHVRLRVTPQVVSGLATLAVEVPSFIPVIGGFHPGGAGLLWDVTPYQLHL